MLGEEAHFAIQVSKTYMDRLMDLQSVKLKDRGEKDLELFEVVMKHMRAAEKEADEVLAKRKKDAENGQVEDSDEEMQDDQVGVQSDGGVLRNQKYNRRNVGSLQKQNTGDGDDCVLLKNNNYGASGSSAGYSDSDILGLKAPFFKRPPWRPRNNRFYAGYEMKKKQWNKKNNKKKDMSEEMLAESEKLDENGKSTGMVGGSKKKKPSKRIITCGKCKLKGHNATQCYTLPVTDATAASHFDA